MERQFKDMSVEERQNSNAKVLETAKAHKKASEKLAEASKKKTANAEKYAKQQEAEIKKQLEAAKAAQSSGLDKIIASLVGTDFELSGEEVEALKTG